MKLSVRYGLGLQAVQDHFCLGFWGLGLGLGLNLDGWSCDKTVNL